MNNGPNYSRRVAINGKNDYLKNEEKYLCLDLLMNTSYVYSKLLLAPLPSTVNFDFRIETSFICQIWSSMILAFWVESNPKF